MIPELNQISIQQAQPTQLTMKKVQHLMDYANNYQNTCLSFYSSYITLIVDLDAAWLVLPKSRSRIAGYFRSADNPDNKQLYTDNGAILIELYALCHFISSAAEAETKGVLKN